MSSAVEEIDYLEEAHGPGITEIPAELELGAAPEEDRPEPEVLPPGWDQATIEKFLEGAGAGIHMVAGKGERDWLMTEQDLRRIGEPLTRICNRYEAVINLSGFADPLLVAHGLALYGWRSTLEAKRAQRDAEEEVPQGPTWEHGPPEEEAVAPAPSPEDLHQPGYFNGQEDQ